MHEENFKGNKQEKFVSFTLKLKAKKNKLFADSL